MNKNLLSIKALKKSYPREGSTPVDVLKNVNLEVAQGEKIAILGRSGAGKSTLLHILGTLESPSQGEVLFSGEPIFTWNEKRLASFRNRELGFVFQFHYLMLEFTALENVMMPSLLASESTGKAKERAKSLLKKVGLEDRLSHKPSQLSGGEQQRVAIARALMMSPKLLLTDEMTGNLDSETGRQVFDLVLSLQKDMGLSVISVTHDETLARAYDRALFLTQGEIKASN
jgi:lipoprotein-releasing system ATP-binding protein